MFSNAFRGSKNVIYKPASPPTKRTIRPHYVERDVDTEFECAECAIRFQVYGIFGYCPGCSCENLQIYDANWANIKRKLSTDPDKDRQLRHAYGDLVSTFEVFAIAKPNASVKRRVISRFCSTLVSTSRITRALTCWLTSVVPTCWLSDVSSKNGTSAFTLAAKLRTGT